MNPYRAPTADLSRHDSGAATYDPPFFAVRGRIGRLRYLAYSFGMGLLMLVLFAMVGVILSLLMAVTRSDMVMVIVLILVYVPVFAVIFILAKRRLNDMGHSGWLSLLLLVPVVGFALWLWLMIGAGDAGANKYGPAPGPNSALVIAGAIIMPLFLVAIIGILAAIAIPAYQKMEKSLDATRQPAPAPARFRQ